MHLNYTYYSFIIYLIKKISVYIYNPGEMAEWSNAPVLKTGVPQGTGGSNPSFSA